MKQVICKIRIFKKRHFQLLEIMVAMILITLCAAPALKIYTNMYKQQTDIVHDYEADHLIHNIHAKIIEKIYNKTISFDGILMGDDRSFEDKELSDKLKKIGYKCHYTIKKIAQRKVRKEEFVRYLCELNIAFVNQTNSNRNKNYRFEHLVQGPPIQGVLLEEESDDHNEDDSPNIIDQGTNNLNKAQKNLNNAPNGAIR